MTGLGSGKAVDYVLLKQCIDGKRFGKFKVDLQSGKGSHVDSCPTDYLDECPAAAPTLVSYDKALCVYHSAGEGELIAFDFSDDWKIGNLLIASSSNCPFYAWGIDERLLLCMPSSGFVGKSVARLCSPSNTATSVWVAGLYNGGTTDIKQNFSELKGSFIGSERPAFFGYVDHSGVIHMTFPDDATYTGVHTAQGIEWSNDTVWTHL